MRASRRFYKQAGNKPLESSSVVPLEQGIGLRRVRTFCIRTMHEMAAELGQGYMPPIRIPLGDSK